MSYRLDGMRHASGVSVSILIDARRSKNLKLVVQDNRASLSPGLSEDILFLLLNKRP